MKRLRTGPARGSVGGLVEWFFASLVWLIVIAFGLSVLAHLIFAAVFQLL